MIVHEKSYNCLSCGHVFCSISDKVSELYRGPSISIHVKNYFMWPSDIKEKYVLLFFILSITCMSFDIYVAKINVNSFTVIFFYLFVML